jgi:glyoxylase-like metal-dependent hydrolase (beta-lactamase superfamily II)
MYIRDSGKISEDSYIIDAKSFGIEKQNAVYFIQGDKYSVLIDTGTQSDARTINKYIIKQINCSKIDMIIVTHSHLDHAGGIPYFIRKYNDIKVVLSEKAMELREQIQKYIDKRELEAQIIPVKEGDTFKIGLEHELMILDTPGHSMDHISIFDEKSKYLYVGDAIGAFHIGEKFCRPTAYFPNFEFTDYLNTLQRVLDLEINGVGIASYGFVKGKDSKDLIKFGHDTFIQWYETIKQLYYDNLEIDAIFYRIIEKFGKSPGEIRENRPEEWIKRFLISSIKGFIEYIKKG